MPLSGAVNLSIAWFCNPYYQLTLKSYSIQNQKNAYLWIGSMLSNKSFKSSTWKRRVSVHCTCVLLVRYLIKMDIGLIHLIANQTRLFVKYMWNQVNAASFHKNKNIIFYVAYMRLSLTIKDVFVMRTHYKHILLTLSFWNWRRKSTVERNRFFFLWWLLGSSFYIFFFRKQA